jgi:transposase-like protein
MQAQFTARGVCVMKSFPIESRGSRTVRKGGRVRKRSVQERQRLLVLLERSGQSLKRFSREHGVALSTLTFWRRRARESTSRGIKGRLVEVRPVLAGRAARPRSSAPDAPHAVQIRLPNCIELSVLAGTDSAWLGALLRELSA